MTEKVTKPEIHRKFINSLGDGVGRYSNVDEVPFEVHLQPPLPPKVRIYAYNVTHPPGGRSNSEHRIQLIHPDQKPSDRASFDHSGGFFVLLLGYVPDSDVFIIWDAGLHRNFAYSKNVQVKAKTVYAALGGEIGTQRRNLQTGTEIVVAAAAGNLVEAIEQRFQLTQERLTAD